MASNEERALRILTRVVSDSPFRARDLIDRVCAATRDAFGFKRVEWHPPHALVPVRDAGQPPPDAADLSVLTALGEAAAAVAQKARDVGDAERIKYDFVSIASHELRAPISVVHGIAATLQARVDDLRRDQVHALLGQLTVQTDRLRELADQLLDLSRIESDGSSARPERFDPRERLLELVPRIAGDRAADVEVHGEAGQTICADAVAFDRVAANLILNALRYGAPPVDVRLEEQRLVVEDHGPGVAPEFVPQLFERFTRSDESRRSGQTGSGLGLAIAAAYARCLGGKLGYESAQPRGARFTLSLPAARS
jgi:signal transduction histidine kinase